MKITVYRVQNAEGQGYLSALTSVWIGVVQHNLADGTERHRHPDADAGTPLHKRYNELHGNLSSYLFGFKNLDDLQTWFTRFELRTLSNAGFDVYECRITSNDVFHGTRQLMFGKNSLISVEGKVRLYRT